MNLRQHKRRAYQGMADRFSLREKALHPMYRTFVGWLRYPGDSGQREDCLRYEWRVRSLYP